MSKIGSVILIAAAAFAVYSTPTRAEHFATAEVGVTDFFVGERYFRTELYFGFGRKDGTEVTIDEWNKFLADEVTPRFPDGLTIVEAAGQFRGASGTIVRERSRMIILLYKKKDRESASKKIDEIRAAYCKQFDQESVLRLDFQ